MRLLFVADGRSPTTLSWLSQWINSGDEVHLVSTYPCKMPPGLESFHMIPVAFSGMAAGPIRTRTSSVVSRLRAPLRALRYYLGPASLPRYQKQFQRIMESIHPDLVHALRIPYEGMLSYDTPLNIPFLVSIWGNDITLHAHGSPLMGRLTRRVLRRADALLADTQRDIRLGVVWGLRERSPTLIVPGAGGIKIEIIKTSDESELPEEIPVSPLVVNPRGYRPGSMRQDIFFRAIPKILKKIPDAFIICPNLRGDAQAESWVTSLGIKERVRLWPKLTQPQLWTLFRKTHVFVSPSIHDGMPNSLLEAMACGCFPVTGDIESMQEWITDGVNGLLVDANDEMALADAVVRSLSEPALQLQAAKLNLGLVTERADYTRNMQLVRELYEREILGI